MPPKSRASDQNIVGEQLWLRGQILVPPWTGKSLQLPTDMDAKRSMIRRPISKSHPESWQSLARMKNSCARGFFDITSTFDLTSVHYKLDYEQMTKTGKYVSIDPSDTEAVATYFRTTHSIPLEPVVGGESQGSTQVQLGYLYLDDDTAVSFVATEQPKERHLDGCCIVLLPVHLPKLSDPCSDVTLQSNTKVVPRNAQIIESKVCWDRHLTLADLPTDFLTDQFSRFRQAGDGSVTWSAKSRRRALKKSEIIRILVDAINGLPCTPDGVYLLSCNERCRHHKDPDYKYADCVLEYVGPHMILVLLRKPDRSPDTTERQIFPAEDIEMARSACTSFTKKEQRPVFCLLTDLTNRWVIIWNMIGRPGVLGYEPSSHGMVYQQELRLPMLLALPVIRGLLRYCVTDSDIFYQTSWWSVKDRPNDTDDGTQGASEEPDGDPEARDRCRRRRDFFNVFNIM